MATSSGSGSGSGGVALQSCSADMVFILGTRYLYLGVLRLRKGLSMQ